jgi:transcriptional regulator with XRE-family HTH domain
MSARPSGRQIRAARALAGLHRGELADLASVHISYVIMAEAESTSSDQVAAIASIQRALESCGIEFGPDGWIRYRRETPRVQELPPPGLKSGTELSPAQLRKELRSGKRLVREIGAACRRGRDSLGLTQQEASERIGVSAEYYARIERGVSVPSTVTMFHIAHVFGVDLDKLIKDGVGVTNPWAWTPEHVAQEFPAESFGALCRRARKAKDLTQHAVGRRIGVSPNFYSRIERGAIVPSLAVLWLLARTLDVRVNGLLRAPGTSEQGGAESADLDVRHGRLR